MSADLNDTLIYSDASITLQWSPGSVTTVPVCYNFRLQDPDYGFDELLTFFFSSFSDNVEFNSEEAAGQNGESELSCRSALFLWIIVKVAQTEVYVS